MLLELHCRHRLSRDFELDVAFALERRFNVLVGPSGAGKTTILAIIAGLVRPVRGRAQLGDRTLFDSAAGVCLPPERRAVGMVFQDALLFPHLTVEANLRYGQLRRKGRRGIPFGRAVDVLELGGLLDRLPRNLSGGERQRVALGRALLSGPELLLMDEPVASLDQRLKAKTLAYLQRAVAEWDIPSLYVTHSPAEVQRAAEWVVAIDRGRVVATGPPPQTHGTPLDVPRDGVIAFRGHANHRPLCL